MAAAGKPVVHVPRQVSDDASIRLGTRAIATAHALLCEVRERRPDASIVYKPNPDVLSDNRAGFLKDGGYYWKSGMFMLKASTCIEELRRHEPKIARQAELSLQLAKRDNDFVRLDPDAFAASPGMSVDYAVMERTAHAAAITARTSPGTTSARGPRSRRSRNLMQKAMRSLAMRWPKPSLTHSSAPNIGWWRLSDSTTS
jgi:hypothetical protein